MVKILGIADHQHCHLFRMDIFSGYAVNVRER